MASHKIERIESDILKYLSNIILTETRDELLKTITLTGAKVSKDLCYAKIYFTSISDMDHKDIDLKCQLAILGLIYFTAIPGLVISKLMVRREPSALKRGFHIFAA